MKYFVSYSRTVKSDTFRLVELLRAKGHKVWWDADIPPMQAWWATILDKIEWCDVFLFVVSAKSVKSPYCLAELEYATDRNRPIFPLIIDDQTDYDIPPVVTPRLNQWLRYDGDIDETTQEIILAVARLDQRQYEDVVAPRPPEPGKEHTTLVEQFQHSMTLAEYGTFEEAVKQFREVEALDHKKWGPACKIWIAKIAAYREVANMVKHKGTLRMAQVAWATYEHTYSENQDLFDPLDLAKKIILPSTVPVEMHPAVYTSLEQKLLHPRSVDIMPGPFAWIDIPAGHISLIPKELNTKERHSKQDIFLDVGAFAITKYPITNEQYSKFIKAGGYREKRWWTEEGWAKREVEAWIEPREWHKTQWNSIDQPVVGVSWYESIAFCLWLAEITGKNIRLPKEQEWQWAAQGDKAFVYPWGNKWDSLRCNNEEKGPGFTTPVTRYEGVGNSPYGVVDMAGNVFEWCLTKDSDRKSAEVSEKYVVKGGAWNTKHPVNFRAGNRTPIASDSRFNFIGFRCIYSK